MKTQTPRYLLFSAVSRQSHEGQWSFVLQAADGPGKFEVADSEPDARGERLELLAVVRGLEALDQPSQVTIVTSSRYVRCGIAYGLEEWRTTGWTWERYGHMVPVKNQDLWQRLDRALRYHNVQCRHWRVDPPHQAASKQGSSVSSRPHFAPKPDPGWLVGSLRRAWACLLGRATGSDVQTSILPSKDQWSYATT